MEKSFIKLVGLAALVLGSVGCNNPKIAIETRSGEELKIDLKKINQLKSSIDGVLIFENDSQYNEARKIWNLARFDYRPALIIQCSSTDDIQKSISFVKDNNLKFSVKSTGHNSAAFASNEGGVVIDLSLMKGIYIDPEAKTAVVQPGVVWGELDATTQQYGLAVTGAIVSEVGIGGYTLGGGLGWLHRSLGAACDNLIEAQIVTADGDLLTINKNQNPELFWAIRGGGGNFGIVTSFKFQLHDVGPDLMAGLLFYPIEEAQDVVKNYLQYIDSVPDDLGTWLLFRKAPASSAIPEELHHQPVIIISATYNGLVEDGEKFISPLKSLSNNLLLDLVKKRKYAAWQKALDGAWGDGFHNIWKGHYLNELPPAFIDTVVAYTKKASLHSDIKFQHLEGAFGRVDEQATAMGHRNSKFGMVIQTRWENDEETTEQEKWTEGIFTAAQRFGNGGVYVNFVDKEGKDRVKDAYNQNSFQRLKEIKAKYDPTNLFSGNQNIEPKD